MIKGEASTTEQLQPFTLEPDIIIGVEVIKADDFTALFEQG